MKKEISRLDENEIIKQYPIKTGATGWYFRQKEVSACVWQVEGTDLFGRKVQRTGEDSKDLLNKCSKDAEDINTKINSNL
jgi:hypothetical protein